MQFFNRDGQSDFNDEKIVEIFDTITLTGFLKRCKDTMATQFESLSTGVISNILNPRELGKNCGY